MERQHVSLFQGETHREEDNSFVFPTCDIILKTFQVIVVFGKWGLRYAWASIHEHINH